ncbi:MAG: hypothetical protein K0S19_1170, partial [Geminicoccaceae bacterium]|nr:hypothetical protein [Geminicoccaceae bacterium]
MYSCWLPLPGSNAISLRERQISSLAGPLILAGLLLCARIVSVPALHDPVSGSAPAAAYLNIPPTYLILAPLFTLWDGVSMLSMRRLTGFLIGLVVLYLLWRVVGAIRRRAGRRPIGYWILREAGVLVASVALLLGFIVIGLLWHRPMLSLGGTHPDDAVVDFHSHTTVSHDVRDTWMRGFDLEANRRWHARAGFDAALVTDHNVVSELLAVSRQSPDGGRGSSPATILCPGIELSLWRAHIVLLGATGPVDRGPYQSHEGLLALLGRSDSVYGALSLASLPEYRRNHWDRLDQLAAAGLDGFEIVNASPKANELAPPEVGRVIDVARRHNRFVAGVSDSHGWGATSMVWNLVRTGGSSPDPCSAVLSRLRTGFTAVRVIERHRLR